MKIYRGQNLRHPRKPIYTKSITLRIDDKTLNNFKAIVGNNYQTKIRELMNMYIDAYNRKKKDLEQ